MIETKFKQTEIGLIPEDWGCVITSSLAISMNDGPFGSNLKQEHYTQNREARIIQLGNIGDNGWNDENVKYTTYLYANIISKYIVNPGDVLVAKMMPAGRAIICPSHEKCFIQGSDAIKIVFSSNAIISQYFVYFTKSKAYLHMVEENTQGSTRQRISITKYRNFPCALPPIKEQTMIVSALTSVDNLLSSLDKLIAKKRDIKQGAMQQLLTGKTRLKGFTEPWGEYYVKDLGIFMKGHGISKAQAQSGDIPAVRYGELYTVHNNYIKTFQSCISQEVANEAVILQKGDILFACSGETKEEIGKCAAYVDDFKAYAGGDIIILRTDNAKYSALFLGFILNAPSVARQKAGKGQGDAIVHISKDALASITIHLPSLREQQAIAIALKSIDDEIAALEAKRKKYEAVKQGMMQQLLTGKIRLL